MKEAIKYYYDSIRACGVFDVIFAGQMTPFRFVPSNTNFVTDLSTRYASVDHT